MLFILNTAQETVGVANNSSPKALHYFNDLHIENLQGVNTYTFTVPSEHEQSNLLETEGYVIFNNLDGEQLLFTIKEISEGNFEGMKTKNVYCEETAITDLLGYVQRPRELKSASLEQALDVVMNEVSDWKVGEVPYKQSQDIVFEDYMTTLEALRLIASEYFVEMYFTVELQGTKIKKKTLNVVEKRGEITKVRFDYSYDLVGVSRTENSENLVSALIGIGKGDDKGKRLSLATLGAFVEGDIYKEAGSDWIGSESALQRIGKNGVHRFGIFLDDKSTTVTELKRRTIKELKDRIVPRVYYSASVINLERITGYSAKKVRLGDTILVNDKTYNPPIVIEARAVELQRSYTDPSQDKIYLGRYKQVTLNENGSVRDLQRIISQQEAVWNSKRYVIMVQALNGVVFKNGKGSTTLVAKVMENSDELDTNGTQFIYKWFKYDMDGKIVKSWGGTTDYKKGKTIVLTGDDVDAITTIKLQVETIE